MVINEEKKENKTLEQSFEKFFLNEINELFENLSKNDSTIEVDVLSREKRARSRESLAQGVRQSRKRTLGLGGNRQNAPLRRGAGGLGAGRRQFNGLQAGQRNFKSPLGAPGRINSGRIGNRQQGKTIARGRNRMLGGGAGSGVLESKLALGIGKKKKRDVSSGKY